MIHTYAWLAALAVSIVALFFSRHFMLRIGVSPGSITNLAAILYAIAALFGVLGMFDLKFPHQFWPYYMLFGFLIFIIVQCIVVFGIHTRASTARQ